MALAFSSSDQAVIDRTTDVCATSATASTKTTECDLGTKYEIQRCVDWINKNQYKIVALQFPDEMLVDSVQVTLAIQNSVTADLYILGDTSYGSCCIDEVAAEHIKAEAIIHFGHTCLSYPSRLPVCFVFGKEPCPLGELEGRLKSLITDPHAKLLLVCDVIYDHAKDIISQKLRNVFQEVVVSDPIIPDVTDRENCVNEVRRCARRIVLPESAGIEDYRVLFVGPENRTLSYLVMTFSLCQCYSFNPLTHVARLESTTVNRHLARRYHMIERAKDAQIIGVLVGTLGVRHYLQAIEHLKSLIKAAGKKSYTLAMGKLNVAKLANFEEVDVYVLVACPENTLLDSKEFFRPVVTPFELEIALNASREWGRDYTTDYGDILPGGDLYVEQKASEGTRYDVSLATGSIRKLGIEEKSERLVEMTVATKVGTVAVPSLHTGAAGEYLMRRTWQGLDPELGKTAVADIAVGKKGIAAGYEGEGENEEEKEGNAS
ncbi:2-(3-amino-3-carboxypropyl)histidine synthase subunit 2-like [Ornithodoros turicata]|uniref:2-(3-amino-3-carboxypropyl)histidine synthase subunit 2-like n=1 Tax=Ornithodoros turicata TaxID=34597 RepID=UPI003139DC3C